MRGRKRLHGEITQRTRGDARIRYHSQAYINLLEREAAMARVTWLAEHDPLPAVLIAEPGTSSLTLNCCRRGGYTVAVAICDIDLFKKVTIPTAPKCGDEAIKHVVELSGTALMSWGVWAVLAVRSLEFHQNFLMYPSSRRQPLRRPILILRTSDRPGKKSPLQWNEHVLT
ncbi:MAG: hypothetical protein Ct9H300mP14_06590 [Gammaproteobacteria bacterium]|nr:MAG: hypothetical protein Ct9H300mP14_06590 [Gammaproteobacteria bacterium]